MFLQTALDMIQAVDLSDLYFFSLKHCIFPTKIKNFYSSCINLMSTPAEILNYTWKASSFDSSFYSLIGYLLQAVLGTTVIPLCGPGEMENCTTALSKYTAQLFL